MSEPLSMFSLSLSLSLSLSHVQHVHNCQNLLCLRHSCLLPASILRAHGLSGASHSRTTEPKVSK